MQTSYLSARERKKGQSYFILYAAFNGLGFSLLGDTIVYLLAMEFAATNLQLGYISSGIHIAGLILPVVPWLFKGRNIRNVLMYSWFVRGFVCLLYGGLFFISDKRIGSYLVVIIYSLFCLSRSIGVASSEALQKTLVTPASTGEFVVRINTAFQTSKLGSQIFNFFYFSVRFLNSLFGIIIVQWLGVIANTISALQVRKIPCRETIENKKGENFFGVLLKAFSTRKTALPFVLRWIGLMMLIQSGFFIPFLRRSIGFEANQIFGVTILMSVAAMTGNALLKPFADRIGSKFLLSVSSLGVVVVFIILVCIPAGAPIGVYFAAGFFISLFTTLSFVLISRIVIQSIPETGKMSYSSAMNFSSALLSLTGGIAGGLLADLSSSGMIPLVGDFDLPFLFAALLGFVIALISLLVGEIGGMTMKDAAQVIFSSRNLRAFLDVYQLNTAPQGVKRQTLLYKISQSDAPIAAAEVQRILNDPLSTEKGEMLRYLFGSPMPSVLPYIIRDALTKGSYTRRDSIFSLGAYPGEETETALLSLLTEEDPWIYSNAVKSLGRIGYKNDALIKEISTRFDKQFMYPESVLNYVIALFHMAPEGDVLSRLFCFDFPEGLGESVFSLFASLMDARPSLSEIYQMELQEEGSGVSSFLEETRDIEPFLEHGNSIALWFENSAYDKVWDWQRSLLNEHTEYAHKQIFSMLMQDKISKYTKCSTVAALYFTFVLLSRK